MKPLTEERPDLSVFLDANRQVKDGGKKLSWGKRVELIERQFPSVRNLDWRGAFDRDLDLFAWIIQDILKADGATPGRSGPKPGLDYRTGAPRLRQLMGEDFSMLPFPEAFGILAGTRSMRSLAAKTGLSRSQVHRLLRGDVEPDGYEMEMVAKAFDKEPGYFTEYRRALVVAAIAGRLTDVPEASVKYYAELVRSR